VIGIDQYVAWPQLDNAVSDAMGTARLFLRLGFVEVIKPLLDGAATSEAMHRLVTDDLAHLAPDDSLVLFFAGHGHTYTAHFDDTSVKTGYVIPADAEPPAEHVAATWLRLDSWLSDIARLPPRHILVMIDACHSGVALSELHKWRDGASGPIRDLNALQTRRSRRIITSALDDQRAMDGGPYPGHSLFTGCLIEALSGGLGEDGQHVVTGTEIGQYLQKRVSSYPHTTQTPDFGAFELDGRGDIVIPIPFQEGTSTEPVSKLSGTAPLAATPLDQRSIRNPTRRWPIRVQFVAVTMVIIGGGAAVGSYRLYTNTSDATKNVHWKLRSTPSGAQVFDSQNHLLGITPLNTERLAQPGPVDLVFKHEGYFDKKLSLDGALDADREELLRGATTVHWKLRSTPSSAQVFDGQNHLLGVTPLDTERLAQPGPVDLVFKHEGYFRKKLSLNGALDTDREETLDQITDRNIKIVE